MDPTTEVVAFSVLDDSWDHIMAGNPICCDSIKRFLLHKPSSYTHFSTNLTTANFNTHTDTNDKKFARNFSIGFFLNKNVFKFYFFLVSTGKIYDTGLRNK